MNPRLINAVERAIAALLRHGFVEASECLQIELTLFRTNRISEYRIRHTANSFLSILA
jgi:hypothetical protein